MSFFKIHADHIGAIAKCFEALVPTPVKDAIAIIESLKKLEPIAEGAVHAVQDVAHSLKHKDEEKVTK